jgi:ferredoxin-NADP reductase
VTAPLPECDVYLSGPVGFMKDLYVALRQLGIPKDNFFYEYVPCVVMIMTRRLTAIMMIMMMMMMMMMMMVAMMVHL